MTTIAWDGRSLAADRQSSYHCNPVAKIEHNAYGLVGASGDFDLGLAVMVWLAGNGPKPAIPSDATLTVLHVDHDGKARIYHNALVPIPAGLPFFAIGSGRDYAMGAMAMGASAEEAVRIAARFDESTGGDVDVLTLES